MKFNLVFILMIFAKVCEAQDYYENYYNTYERSSYIEIECTTASIYKAYQQFHASKKPIYLNLEMDSTMTPKHFNYLSLMPIKKFSFGYFSNFSSFYCNGLDKLQSIDSIVFQGMTHPFLKDASKILGLKHLVLKTFMHDTTIKETTTFDQISSLRINLCTHLYSLTNCFSSLKNVTELNIEKSNKIDFNSIFTIIDPNLIQKLGFYFCFLENTRFDNMKFPAIEKAELVSAFGFPYQEFMRRCPNIKKIDLTRNGIKDSELQSLKIEFNDVNIKCNY